MVELDGLEFKLTQDSDGFVTSVEVPGDDLGHDELSDIDDYLMHYGVMGMKWGVRKDRNKSGGTRTKKKSSSSGSSDRQGSGESSKSGSNSGSTKSSKNLTTDQKLGRLDKLSEEKNEILNYTDEVKKAAKEVTDSSGETWDGPLKTILEFHPKGVDIADSTADKMGFYDPNSDTDINKLLKKYRKREFRHDEVESDLDDYLMHYGVKGMKWGVRKDGKPQGYQGGSSKSKSKSKSKTKTKTKRKSKPRPDAVDRIKSNLKKTAGKIKDARKDRKKAKPKPKPKAKRELDVSKAEAEAHAINARRDSSPSLFSPDTTKTMLTDRTRTGGMTDAELKATIQRMHLETAYAKLVRENTPKSTSQKLMAFAKETATDIAKQQVKRVAGEFAGDLVNKAIGKGLADAKDQKKKEDPKPKADAPKSESKPKPKPKAEAPKPSPTTAPASEPKRPAPTWRPTPPGPGRPPNKPPASEPKRPAPTWRPTGSPRTTPNTSNYVFGDRGRNYEGRRRAQDLIDNHATVTVAELMERRKRRERR